MNFHQLWVNNQRAVRARYPDSGYLKVRELPDSTPEWMHGHSRFGYSRGDIPSIALATNAEVVVMNRWVESRLPISGVDEQKRIASFSRRSVFQLQTGDLYYLEGAIDHLNLPGEWCLAPAASKVYYLPRAGERIDTAEIIAPALQQVVRFEGDGLAWLAAHAGAFSPEPLLAAVAVAWAMDLSPDLIAAGLETFEPDPEGRR